MGSPLQKLRRKRKKCESVCAGKTSEHNFFRHFSPAFIHFWKRKFTFEFIFLISPFLYFFETKNRKRFITCVSMHELKEKVLKTVGQLPNCTRVKLSYYFAWATQPLRGAINVMYALLGEKLLIWESEAILDEISWIIYEMYRSGQIISCVGTRPTTGALVYSDCPQTKYGNQT